MGSNRTICFTDVGCVGAFYDVHSSRDARIVWNSFLAEVPTHLQPTAEHLLSGYMLNIVPENISNATMVTTMFWQVGDNLQSLDTLDEMLAHGGHVMEQECLLDTVDALRHYRENYGLPPQLLVMAREIFDRRIESSTTILDVTEIAMLKSLAADQDTLAECLAKFADVNVTRPAGVN